MYKTIRRFVQILCKTTEKLCKRFSVGKSRIFCLRTLWEFTPTKTEFCSFLAFGDSFEQNFLYLKKGPGQHFSTSQFVGTRILKDSRIENSTLGQRNS